MWEYKTVGFGTVSPSADELNKAAIGGWRLVSLVTARNGLTGVFERAAIGEEKVVMAGNAGGVVAVKATPVKQRARPKLKARV